jgi:hypothetical protein
MNSEMENTQPIINDIKQKKTYEYEKYKEKKQEKMKEYFKNNKDIRIECDICKKKYSIFNQSHHRKSQHHLLVLQILEEQQRKL